VEDTTPTNEAHGVNLILDAYRRWETMPPVDVSVQRHDGYILLGGLQLLTRHPEIAPDLKEVFVRCGREIQRLICDDPELYALAEVGWDPVQDVPR
jgi:hypothetical protein